MAQRRPRKYGLYSHQPNEGDPLWLCMECDHLYEEAKPQATCPECEGDVCQAPAARARGRGQ